MSGDPDSLGSLIILFTNSADLLHPYEEHGNLSSPKVVTQSLEGKPVLTINSTSIVSRALLPDAGDTERKGRAPMSKKVSLMMGERKFNTNGHHCRDGDGRRLSGRLGGGSHGSPSSPASSQAPCLGREHRFFQTQILEAVPEV